MDKIFKPYFDWLIVYIDDVLIFSKNIQGHFKHVHTFKQLVKHNGLVLSKKKIEVFQTTIKFLGHTIFKGQISLQKHALEFVDIPRCYNRQESTSKILGFFKLCH